MQVGEKEKAYKSLMKAGKIDVNNIITLRYLNELGESGAAHTNISEPSSEKNVREDIKNIIPVSTYKEDKPNIFAFVNLILGVIIGVAVVYFLIVPTVEKKINNEYKNKDIKYSSEQSTNSNKIKGLETEKADLETKVADLQKQIDEFEKIEIDESLYDNLFTSAKQYMDKDKEKAAETLLKVKEGALDNTAAKSLYDFIKNDTFKSMSDDFFVEGRNLYNSQKYDEALKKLNKAVEMNPENVDAIYFIGRTYHRLDDKENAITYYNKVIHDFPDSARVAEAKSKLKEIN
jgi:tetratricopeptide (TPR) repeat protein